MKRAHLNLLLLVIVAGLGATVWLTQKKEEKGAPLTALKQDAVTRIALEHPGKPVIRLEKKDGKWRLTEPVQAETDSFEVNGILGLAEFEVKAKLDAGASKAELELDPPKYTVTLDDTKILVGGTEPIKFRRYVLSADQISLVDDPPSAALDADYSDLVSKALVPEGSELSRIELPGLRLEKAAEGGWTSPQQGEAKPAQVTKLAESWKNARAMWNAAETAGESSEGDAVKLTMADGRVIDLVVAERDPQLVLASKALGLRYTLSKALVEELFKIPEEPKPEATPSDAPKPAEVPAAEEKPAEPAP